MNRSGMSATVRRGVRVAIVVLVVLPLMAQRGGGRGGGRPNFNQYLGSPNDYYTPPDFHGNPPYDGRFTFARIKYRGFLHFTQEGPGWSHDYPDADVHFMRIIREITSIRPFVEKGPIQGGVIVALDDPALFKYPVAYLSEPGGWLPNDVEAKGLRDYLKKGGFLIVDDFSARDWGRYEAAMQKVLPDAKTVQLTGKEPIFDAFYKIDISKANRSYYGTGTFWGIYENNDPRKRLIAVINYNNDIGESWQWSGQGYFPVDVTNEAYKLGVNYLVYALTH